MLTLEAVVAESSSVQSKEVPLDGSDNMEFVVVPAGGIVRDVFLIRVTIFKAWIRAALQVRNGENYAFKVRSGDSTNC
jgi:hypothetical protein